MRARRLVRLRSRHLARRPWCSRGFVEHRGRAQRARSLSDDRPDRGQPHQPAPGRAVVRTPPRDRRPRNRRALVRPRVTAHRVDGAELSARAGPRPSIAAGVGSRPAVPAARDRHRAHRRAHRRRPSRHRLHQRDVPGLRRHAADGGRRTARVPHPDGARLPVADVRRHDVDPRIQRMDSALRHASCVRVPPARAQAPAVALPAEPVVAEVAGAHALDQRARRRLSRCPLCDDPSRRRRRSAVGLRALQHPGASSGRRDRHGRHRCAQRHHLAPRVTAVDRVS